MQLNLNAFFKGDVSPSLASEALNSSESILIDVRTTQEWHLTGVPDTCALGGENLVKIEWIQAPTMTQNPDFLGQFLNALSGMESLPKSIYFICKAGGRSYQAAAALTDYFQRQSTDESTGHTIDFYNVSEGVEGSPAGAGWIAAGLPVKQASDNE